MFLIYIPILLILTFWTIKFVYRIYWHGVAHKRWFRDELVQQLCVAARKGQLKKIDKLIELGANINYQGKDGMTPLIWLMISTSHNRRSKKSFAHLLQKTDIDIDLSLTTPILTPIIYETGYNLFKFAALAKDDDYLEMILKYYKPTGKELDFNSTCSTLKEVASTNNLERFEMLLNYDKTDLSLMNEAGKNTMTRVNIGGDSWPFVYYSLVNGSDYMNANELYGESQTKKPYLFWSIEDYPGDNPANILSCCKGIDYRQKVIDWLKKEKGIKLKPWMPEDEKYIKKDGENVLFVKRNGKWKEYKKTLEYFYNRYWICADPVVRLFKKIWNTVYIGL